jgi:glutaminyl-tRNA synthetase
MNFIEEKILSKGNLDRLKLRFAPEPNGYLHIGHAKSICLNFGLAKKYNRPCNLRFDDTNPITEDSNFVNSIIEDIKWLGYKPANILYTSDYFDFIYECAITLIKKGLAYVDDSTSEEIANLKGTTTLPGKDSPYKSRTIEENLDLFNRMKIGEFKEGSKTLRANINMSSPNMILRDPVIYRIIEKEHHRTGNNWKIYPMYDFAHPLSDYKEEITDSLCTLEFEVHKPLYIWVLENCTDGINLPEETEFARLNIDYTVMSKRKLKRLVEEGYLDGWDDPRMPTISGLRRRGYTPESIINFCDIVGVTKKESVISYLLLEECLRKDLNKNANRLMGVLNPIKVIITNWKGDTEWVEVENNPENESSGKRLIPFTGDLWIESDDFRIEANSKFHRLKIGGEVRLKGGYVIKANDFKEENGLIKEVYCTYDPNSKSGMELDRKIKGTIHWVSVKYGIRIDVNEYDKLFINSIPEKGDKDFISYFNKDSLVLNNKAVFEPSVSEISGTVQMMRKGYFILDKDSKSIIKTVNLKEGWNG